MLPALLALAGCDRASPDPAAESSTTRPSPDALLVVERGEHACVLRVRDGARSWLLGPVSLCARELRYALSPDRRRLLAHLAFPGREILVRVDLGGGVEELPPLSDVAAVSWSSDGAPLAVTVDASNGAGKTWRLDAGRGWVGGASFTVDDAAWARIVPNGSLRAWALPVDVQKGLSAPGWEEHPVPVTALTAGGPGAGWVTDGEVAVHPPSEGPAIGPVAIRLASGNWVEPDALQGSAPVTWERAGDLLIVRLHGERVGALASLADPDAPQTNLVFERAYGGILHTGPLAVAPWPVGAASLPTVESECGGEARLQSAPPGALPSPVFPDCRPPGTPDWTVSERFVSDYPLDVRSGDDVSVCVDGKGAATGRFRFERPVREGRLVVRGTSDSGERTLSLERPGSPPILLGVGTIIPPGVGTVEWMCTADDETFCPCGTAAVSFGLGMEPTRWDGRRGARRLDLDLEVHDEGEGDQDE